MASFLLFLGVLPLAIICLERVWIAVCSFEHNLTIIATCGQMLNGIIYYLYYQKSIYLALAKCARHNIL